MGKSTWQYLNISVVLNKTSTMIRASFTYLTCVHLYWSSMEKYINIEFIRMQNFVPINSEFVKAITLFWKTGSRWNYDLQRWTINGYLSGGTYISVIKSRWAHINFVYLIYSFWDGYQTMDHSWLGVRKGNIQTISFGWGQNDWDSTLHYGPPYGLFRFPLTINFIWWMSMESEISWWHGTGIYTG
jgi:hypothetical protein